MSVKDWSDEQLLARYAYMCGEFAVKRRLGRRHTLEGQIVRQYRDEILARLSRVKRGTATSSAPGADGIRETP